ncbi:MAG: NUDIX hydrolase [Candidatus Sulfobium sp.]|jgi:ADP-ribose pyrophosphatase
MKIIDRKIVCEGRFLRSVVVTYAGRETGPDGKGKEIMRDWEAVERIDCGGIAVIVPLKDDGTVLLTRQFRPPVDSYVIELPAGLAAVGEPLEEAARRELVEETGYSAGKLDFLTEGPLSSGVSSEILSAFVATALTFTGISGRDETEDIEVLEAPLDRLYADLEKMRRNGDLIDLKIYGLIELAKDFMESRNGSSS